MNKSSQSGFTLYELLVTVVVVGVIIGFGVPNLRQFQLNNRMVAASNDLLAAFALARTEAIKRKTFVTVCASQNPFAAVPVCSASDGADDGVWHQGWIVFSDDDNDLVIDAPDDDLLRVGGPPPGNDTGNRDAAGNIKISTNGNAQFFTYRGTGFGTGDRPGGVDALAAAYVYDQRGNYGEDGGVSTARVFIVSPAGRAQMYRDPEFIEDICTDVANFNLNCPIL